jgi:CBS domain-containing protein
MLTAVDLMRREVIVLEPGDRLAEAREMMRLGRLRQVPVVSEPWIVGEISWREACLAYRPVLEAVSEAGARERAAAVDALAVARVMHPTSDWVAADAHVTEVVARLERRACGFVPVVAALGESRLQLLGVITENDLLRAALAAGNGRPALRPGRP